MRNGFYKSLSEKNQFFSSRKTVRSVEELLTSLRQYQDRRYVFRGQSNALWKIRSSALRWWQDEWCGKCSKVTNYLEFLNKAFQYSQKPEFPQLQPRCRFGNKFAWFGDHEKMGYLQHYGYPTPLIDFTHDFYVALYMATRNKKSNASYFSIYILDPNTRPDNEIYSFEELVEKNAEDVEQLHYMTNFYEGGLQTPESGWCQHSCVLIHKDGNLWCPHLAKERIVAQGGLFVYMKSAELSLEEQMCEYKQWNTDSSQGKHVKQEVEALDTYPLICIDAPCAYSTAIREIVSAEGYTDEKMGLADTSRDVVAKACFEAFANSITC